MTLLIFDGIGQFRGAIHRGQPDIAKQVYEHMDEHQRILADRTLRTAREVARAVNLDEGAA